MEIAEEKISSNESLSAGEIRTFFGELNKLPQAEIARWPEFIFLTYKGLMKKVMKPNLVLAMTISQVMGDRCLIPIALALRSGGNPNMYISTKKYGDIHILGYLQTLGQPETTLQKIIVLLCLFGASADKPFAYKKPDEPKDIKTVYEWATQAGYKSLDRVRTPDRETILTWVKPPILNELALISDKTNFLVEDYEEDLFGPDNGGKGTYHLRSLNTSDYILQIIAFVPLNKSILPISRWIGGDYNSLRLALTSFNEEAFHYCLTVGQFPSYQLVNEIILKMKTYRETKHVLFIQELEQILLDAIDIGTRLDSEQMALLETMGGPTLEKIKKAYLLPYWKKACSSDILETEKGKKKSKFDYRYEIPDDLRLLAAQLNLPDDSRGSICREIDRVSKVNRDVLIQKNRDRQKARLANNLLWFVDPEEQQPGEEKSAVCDNNNFNLTDYADLDIAYYRDKDGKVWCFTSDAFPAIIEKQINPYNETYLPTTFVTKIRGQLDLLTRLGLATKGPSGYTKQIKAVPFEKILADLDQADKLDDEKSQRILRVFYSLGMTAGFSEEKLNQMKPEDFQRALHQIGFKDVTLNGLTKQHMLLTVAHIIYHVNQTKKYLEREASWLHEKGEIDSSDFDSVKTFFQALNRYDTDLIKTEKSSEKKQKKKSSSSKNSEVNDQTPELEGTPI